MDERISIPMAARLRTGLLHALASTWGIESFEPDGAA
jgi:hypothetical protein